MPLIEVIGIDDSGPACLTQTELELIDRAALLCGGARHLALFSGDKRQKVVIEGDLDSFYERLVRWDGGSIAVLASGDPCFYGIGPLLVQRFGPERVRIHPRASSVATAFARLGIAWQDATVVSVHGRPVAEAIPAILQAPKVAILTDPEHTPAVVAASLVEAGMENCPAYVCERLGGPHERIHQLRLAEIPERDFDCVNVLVLLPDCPSDAPHGFGRADIEYESVRGQITKAEVRTITLARLEPWRASTCWDVGAGCGSVSIEAAGLMRTPAIHAVERDHEQITVLRRNVARHRAFGVCVIEGTAPDALRGLPRPDAVFVGGGGRALRSILELASDRLKPGGRLVANFGLLESLSAWQSFAGAIDWQSDLTEVNVSRGRLLGEGTHLTPLGPVFVGRLVKPEADL
jgi:precorrin-6Y C5,15-methyltransferase (decarboxylating)